jgi:hypothetical protein
VLHPDVDGHRTTTIFAAPAPEAHALPSDGIDPVPHVIFDANRRAPLAGATDG